MLLTHRKMSGRVLFTIPSTGKKIVEITSTSLGSYSDSQDCLSGVDLSKVSMASSWNSYSVLGYRYPQYLVIVSESNGRYNEMFSGDEIAEIESASRPWGSPQRAFSDILEGYKQKDGGGLNYGEYYIFKTLKCDDGRYCFPGSDSRFNVSFEDGDFPQFTIEDSSIDEADTQQLHFVNEFENISVDSNNVNTSHAEMRAIMKRIHDRMMLANRVCPHYMVYKSNCRGRNQIYKKPFNVQKIEGMLNFFGTSRRSQAKIDTLSNCIKGWANKYIANPNTLPIGKRLFVEFGVGSATETPMDQYPVDWILVHSSHMKIIASEMTNKQTARIIVEIVKDNTDDFAQLLYTMIEQSNGSYISISAFDEEVIHKAIESMKLKISHGVLVNVEDE